MINRLNFIKNTKKINGVQYAEYLCICGNRKEISIYNVKIGGTMSCGCLKKENFNNNKHGLYYTRFYNIWNGMKNRCLNINNSRYKDYGARGINICDRWLDFINFKEDMYEEYLEHCKEFGESNTSIDRENNNLGYNKDNCRWATLSQQNINRILPSQKQFKAISPEGIEYIENNYTKFARENDLHASSIWKCLKNIHKQYKGWIFKYL